MRRMLLSLAILVSWLAMAYPVGAGIADLNPQAPSTPASSCKPLRGTHPRPWIIWASYGRATTARRMPINQGRARCGQLICVKRRS